MPIWQVLLLLGCAGAVGGLINGFLANEGLVFFQIERRPGGPRIWRLGFLGNVLVGAVTAVVLAGLYSPLGSVRIGGAGTQDPPVVLTINMLAGALFSGIGGARLLMSEVIKRTEETTRDALGRTIQNLSRPAIEPPRYDSQQEKNH
jgi:hypothetical protein